MGALCSPHYIRNPLNGTLSNTVFFMFLARNWSKRVMWLIVPQHPNDVLQFSKTRVLRKNSDGLINTIASIWREWMCVGICRWTNCVLQSSQFSSASMNCSLLGTDNARGQIFEHIFAPNGGYCLFTREFMSRTRSARLFVFFDYIIALLGGCPVSLPFYGYFRQAGRQAVFLIVSIISSTDVNVFHR